MKVRESPVGVKAFDTLAHIGLPQAQALKKLGFDVAMLYANTASLEDVNNCLSSGICVGFTLLGLAAGHPPSIEAGQANASGAVRRLFSIGVPPGVSLMIDLEGDGALADDWKAYAVAASTAITAAGYKPGYYIGEGTGLNGGEIYSLPGFPYWKSMSRVNEPACGWAMVQIYPDNLVIGGVGVDVDIIGRDYKGRTLWVCEG